MCYKKPGPRCEKNLSPRRKEARIRLREARANQEEVLEAFRVAQSGTPVYDADNRRRTVSGLENETKRLSEKVLRAEAEVAEVERQWLLTETGIAQLKEKAKTAPTAKERSAAAAKAKHAEAERQASIEHVQSRARRARNISIVMEQDGFDADTIAECNQQVDGPTYRRSAETYQKRIAEAHAEINRLNAEWDKVRLKTPIPEKQALAEAYLAKIEEQNLAIEEDTRGYNSTNQGLAELKAASEAPGLGFVARARAIRAHRTALRDATEQKNSVRLHRIRQRSIKKAYAERGLDPARALQAHKQGYMDRYGASRVAPELRHETTHTTLLTPSEKSLVVEQYRASGAPNMSAYIRSRVLRSPSETFTPVGLDDLNAGVKQPTGEPHRQWTNALVEARSAEFSIKWSKKDLDRLKGNAGDFNLSNSSLARAMLLNIDVRQIQNDRSDEANARKTENMRAMGLDTPKAA